MFVGRNLVLKASTLWELFLAIACTFDVILPDIPKVLQIYFIIVVNLAGCEE